MSKRLEWLANIAVTSACVLVLATLARDYVLTPARAAAPTPAAAAPTQTTAAMAALLAQAEAAQIPDELPGLRIQTIDAAGAGGSTIAAVVGRSAITTDQLDVALGNRIMAMRAQEYEVKRNVLEQSIDRMLIEKAAALGKLTVKEFLTREIGGLESPTADEIAKAYEESKGQFAGLTESDAKRLTGARLRAAKAQERLQRLQARLRSADGGVRVLLEPPRVAIDEGAYPTRGGTNAPVTVVEFSDFECPYCARSRATLRDLQARYGDRIRFVFRHFPLPSHKDAAKAAEAAECARFEGRFWQMHDLLFAKQQFDKATLQQDATEAGLAPQPFLQCVDSGKFQSAWRRDKALGEAYGVTSTPTFFVNGRLLLGAVPLDSFTRVIDEELARAERASPKTL